MNTDRTFQKLGLFFAALGTAFLCAGVFALARALSGNRFDDLSIVLLAVFSSLGLVFLTAGIVFLAIVGFAARRMRLVDTGEPVRAQIIDVERQWAVQTNGRMAHRVVCRYDEGGTAYLCRSRYLWFNPASMLRSDTVTVYRDPQNHRKYYVDLSGVLPPTVEL